MVFQDLDESLLFLAAFTVVLFAFPFVLAWLEHPSAPRSARKTGRGHRQDDGDVGR